MSGEAGGGGRKEGRTVRSESYVDEEREGDEDDDADDDEGEG